MPGLILWKWLFSTIYDNSTYGIRVVRLIVLAFIHNLDYYYHNQVIKMHISMIALSLASFGDVLDL